MKKCGILVDLQFVDRGFKKCSEKKLLPKNLPVHLLYEHVKPASKN
jgi:hypothetical protein